MRAELIPVLLGVVVGLVGLALLADARLPDGGVIVLRERRRRSRAERSRRGEGAIGTGTLCLAAALIGRDAWRFGVLSVIVGAVLLLAGAVMNRRYLAEVLSFRGPARRMAGGAPPPGAPAEPPPRRMRIR
jgi:hypothetical protein